MALIKKYRWTLGLLFMTGIISLYKIELGREILDIAGSNLKTLFMLIPPIFILIGLLDVWVPKESMMKHMGEDSGVKGLFYSFMLGTIAVGPLYAAFPIAALLLKKGVKYSNVIFFLSIWMSTKLPLVMVEIGSLGYKFTAIHIFLMVTIYLIGSFLIEKIITKQDKTIIQKNIQLMEG